MLGEDELLPASSISWNVEMLKRCWELPEYIKPEEAARRRKQQEPLSTRARRALKELAKYFENHPR